MVGATRDFFGTCTRRLLDHIPQYHSQPNHVQLHLHSLRKGVEQVIHKQCPGNMRLLIRTCNH